MDKVNCTGTCVMCRQQVTITVFRKDLDRWKAGESYVQDLFPYLSSGEREFLISRTCIACFDSLFPESYAEDFVGEDVDIEAPPR